MFEVELEAALRDSRALTDLAADVERDARVAGCRKLVVAAAWADAHSSGDHPDGGLLVEGWCRSVRSAVRRWRSSPRRAW